MAHRARLSALFFVLLKTIIATAQTVPAADPAATAKYATISGRTVSEAGQPLKKTMLTLRWNGSLAANGQVMPNPYGTVSDADGNFIFEAVEPGIYTLSATRPGYQRYSYGARPGGAYATSITLTPGKVMTEFKVVMSPQLVISGKVLDSDGDPAGQAQVRVSRFIYFQGKRELNFAGGTATDENGEYKFQGLSPGKYYVSAVPLQGRSYGENVRSARAAPVPGAPVKQEEEMVTTFYPGVISAEGARVVELSAGHDHPGTDITLRTVPVFHLRGKVTVSASFNRSQLRVSLSRVDNAYLEQMNQAMSPIAKDGTFDLARISAGQYLLNAVRTDGIYKVVGWVLVSVGTRDVDDLVLSVEAPSEIPGQIVMEKDASAPPPSPAKEVSLSALQITASSDVSGFNMAARANAGDDGQFILSGVSPGKYRVSLFPIPDGMYLKEIRFGDQNVLKDGLEFQSGTGTKLEAVLAPHAAMVSGTVQDAEGKPASALFVTLVPDPAQPERFDLYKQKSTDDSGKFNFTGIAPGKYRIYAWSQFESGYQFDAQYMKTYETKGTKLDLGPSGSQTLALTAISSVLQ